MKTYFEGSGVIWDPQKDRPLYTFPKQPGQKKSVVEITDIDLIKRMRAEKDVLEVEIIDGQAYPQRNPEPIPSEPVKNEVKDPELPKEPDVPNGNDGGGEEDDSVNLNDLNPDVIKEEGKKDGNATDSFLQRMRNK